MPCTPGHQNGGRTQHRLQYLSAFGPVSAIRDPFRLVPGPCRAETPADAMWKSGAGNGARPVCLARVTTHGHQPSAPPGSDEAGCGSSPWSRQAWLPRQQPGCPGTGSRRRPSAGAAPRWSTLPGCGLWWEGSDPAGTRAHATSEDPSRRTTDLLILAANVASLAAVAAVVVDSHRADGGSRLSGGLLALACVALSWILVQTLFTLRYAELYYSTGETRRTGGGRHRLQPGAAAAVHGFRLSRHEPWHDVPGV